MSCIACRRARVLLDKDRQFAKNSLPSRESLGAVGTLENFLQDRRTQPYRVSALQRRDQQINLGNGITAQKCHPNR